jgi:hypothetical protein
MQRMQFWQQQQPIYYCLDRALSPHERRPSLTARKRYSGTDLLGDLAKDDVDPLTGEIRNNETQTPKKCFNNMLSSVAKSEHVIKQCFKTSFDLYR